MLLITNSPKQYILEITADFKNKFLKCHFHALTFSGHSLCRISDIFLAATRWCLVFSQNSLWPDCEECQRTDQRFVETKDKIAFCGFKCHSANTEKFSSYSKYVLCQ